MSFIVFCRIGSAGTVASSSGETAPIPLTDETRVDGVAEEDATGLKCALDLGTKESGPKQPGKGMLNTHYPSRDGRRFNSGYYTKYKWIEFSQSANEVYCFPCRHFSGNACNSGEILGRRSFIDIGYQKFKDIAEGCNKHENSKRHKSAIEAWRNYKLSELSCDRSMSIKSSFVATSDKEKADNREQIKIVFDAIILLARMGQGFRGDNESKDSPNRGNLKEVLDYTKKYVEPDVALKFERRYGHYTSPQIQNECIHLLGKEVQTDIARAVKENVFFAILVDETKDSSKKEQLCILLRYFDAVDNQIKERAIGTFHMKRLNSESLAHAIQEHIAALGIDMKNCVAQCYDGASVMSGSVSGVQTRIRELYPQAIYVHCHAHRLNLVIVDSMKLKQDVANFFSVCQSLYDFISNSNTRNEMFKQAQIDLGQGELALERSVTTRWFYFHNCIDKIMRRFEAILDVLTACASAGNPEAVGYLHTTSSFKFILIMFMCENILRITNVLSKQLQNKSETVVHASSLIKTTASQITKLKDSDAYDEIYVKAVNFAGKHDIAIEDENENGRGSRKKKVSKRLNDFLVQGSLGQETLPSFVEDSDSYKNRFQNEIFQPTIDKVLEEFSDRFSRNVELYRSLQCFDLTTEDKALDANFIDLLANSYQCYFTECNLVSLRHQAETARHLFQTNKHASIFHLFTDLNKLPDAFDQLIKLLRISLTLPVSTASNERFFSVLKRVKNYLRTSCGQERLSDLLLLNVESEFAKKIDLDKVVDAFGRNKKRRYSVL